MSCAACSAPRGKSGLQGAGRDVVQSVSLLTNSMGVEGTASPEGCDCRGCGTEAGYGASKAQGAAEPSAQAPAVRCNQALEDRETPKLEAPPHRVGRLPGLC